MRVELYLVHETPGARLFRRKNERDPSRPDFWIPRSVVSRILKYPKDEGRLQLCEIELEDWFANKLGI